MTSQMVENQTDETNTLTDENNVTDKQLQDETIALRLNKTTGNYSIMRKIKKDNKETVQKARYKIYGAYLPYGHERFNNSNILNAVIDDSNNLNYNLLFSLNKVSRTFEDMKNMENIKNKYNLADKTFYSFIHENKNEKDESNVKKYTVRLYFKYGAKVTHAKYSGELSYNQLKGKVCNIDIELGSMWINEKTKLYGVNILVTHITVLN